jgi:hypothetical protein
LLPRDDEDEEIKNYYFGPLDKVREIGEMNAGEGKEIRMLAERITEFRLM